MLGSSTQISVQPAATRSAISFLTIGSKEQNIGRLPIGVVGYGEGGLLALYSALGYAMGQMLGRKVSQDVDPLVIANMQSVLYLAGAALIGALVVGFGLDASNAPAFAALTHDWATPGTLDLAVLALMGLFSAISSVFFVKAYQVAPANFVAPFEYSAIIAALIYGIFWFHDYPDAWTLSGAAIVVTAGLAILWRDAHVQRRG